MNSKDQIELAKEFATQKFDAVGIKNHFLEVYNILVDEFYINDLDILIAAFLHDTLEDTDTTYMEIENVFSKNVADLVEEVSHPKDYKGAEVTEYYEKLKHISFSAKMIKLADFLSHLRRLIGIYKRGEEGSNPVFVENGRYARDIIAVAETCPDSEAKRVVIELAAELLRLHFDSKFYNM